MISPTQVSTHGATPFFLEAGSGPGVVCLHANASTSGQWRDLMAVLAPTFHVMCPDLYDAGQGPGWPSDRTIGLRDEVALVEPIMARAGARLSLVGHSYGAAVALIAALAAPERVRAMALYEPPLFSLLDPATSEAGEIREVLADACAALDATGKREAAAERFVDYWTGAGAWNRMPEGLRRPVADSVRNLRRWAYALFNEATPLAAFRSLDVPVLYLMGRRSTAASRAVSLLLTAVLPRVEVVQLDGVGHMGPVTHGEVVNTAIQGFLARYGGRS